MSVLARLVSTEHGLGTASVFRRRVMQSRLSGNTIYTRERHVPGKQWNHLCPVTSVSCCVRLWASPIYCEVGLVERRAERQV